LRKLGIFCVKCIDDDFNYDTWRQPTAKMYIKNLLNEVYIKLNNP